MPKSKEYLSSSESGSEDEPKPKKKKEVKEKKEEAKADKGKPQKGEHGEYMFQLSNFRFATVSQFKGKKLVGIREYYDKDGKLAPGKKGISLSEDQWQALKDKIEDIDECCKNF